MILIYSNLEFLQVFLLTLHAFGIRFCGENKKTMNNIFNDCGALVHIKERDVWMEIFLECTLYCP